MDLLKINISASALVIFTIILRALKIKQIPKETYLALWGIVIARLLIPFTIPSRCSFISFIDKLTSIDTSSSNILNNISVARESNSNITNSSICLFNNIQYCKIIWMIGFCLCLAILFIVTFKSYRMLRETIPVSDNRLIEKMLANQEKTIRKIRVFSSDRISSPITYGIIHPKIVFPKKLVISNDEQLKYVISHEMVHIKRLDVLWKFAAMFSICIHWFNPLIWLMFILFSQDLEITCDAKVIRLYGESKKSEYAMSLVNLAEQKVEKIYLLNAFGKGNIKERILSIMKYKKVTIFSIIISIILVAGTAIIFTTSNFTRNTIAGEYNTNHLANFNDNDAYKIGANKYGKPIFKNTNKALKQAMIDYEKGFEAIKIQFQLDPISKNNWDLYKNYGWQLVPDDTKISEQGRKITQFFDIYENSFLDN